MSYTADLIVRGIFAAAFLAIIVWVMIGAWPSVVYFWKERK